MPACTTYDIRDEYTVDLLGRTRLAQEVIEGGAHAREASVPPPLSIGDERVEVLDELDLCDGIIGRTTLAHARDGGERSREERSYGVGEEREEGTGDGRISVERVV